MCIFYLPWHASCLLDPCHAFSYLAMLFVLLPCFSAHATCNCSVCSATLPLASALMQFLLIASMPPCLCLALIAMGREYLFLSLSFFLTFIRLSITIFGPTHLSGGGRWEPLAYLLTPLTAWPGWLAPLWPGAWWLPCLQLLGELTRLVCPPCYVGLIEIKD